MKILVCVKYVPSAADGVRMDESHSLIRDGVIHQLNVADESALELALRLKGEGSVTVMTMGKPSLERGLLELLAKGAEETVLLTDSRFAGADTYATAKTLARAVSLIGPFDLILCGRRAIDGETGQVPAELAAILGFPCVTNVISVKRGNQDMQDKENGDWRMGKQSCQEESGLICTRLVENGTMELLVPDRAVITMCEYSCILRNSGIKGLREARKKRVRILSADELGLGREECGLSGSPTRVKGIERQIAGCRHMKLLENSDEIVERLKEGMGWQSDVS